MALFNRLQRKISKIQKKGELYKVTNAEEARSASENKRLIESKAADLFVDVVDAYVGKITTNKVLKVVLFTVSLFALVSFVVAFIICLFLVINSNATMSETLAILIPAGATVVTSIVSIIIIIAKYLFPRDEDKNFTDLVKVLIKSIGINEGNET